MAGLVWASVMADAADKDSLLVRRIADRVLEEFRTGYTDIDTGAEYATASGIPDGARVGFISKYADWHYSIGVLNLAMLRLSEEFDAPEYAGFVRKQIDNALAEYGFFRPWSDGRDYKPFHYLRKFNELDYCGPESAAMLRYIREYPDRTEQYGPWIERAARHISSCQQRLPDGTLARTWPRELTVWADDLYMGLSFMCEYASAYGDTLMLKDAVSQVRLFYRHLWNSRDSLFCHGYYSDTESLVEAYWGRCNGWIMLATSRLLDVLPEDSGDFRDILALYRMQIEGIVRRQDRNGLWHQLLDRKDTYIEGSCSAIFIYCISHAINEGWISADRYSGPVHKAYSALKRKLVSRDGELREVCVGTPLGDSPEFYSSRERTDGEVHGTGILIEVCLEMMDML